MRALLASGLSVYCVLLRIMDVKYGLIPFTFTSLLKNKRNVGNARHCFIHSRLELIHNSRPVTCVSSDFQVS